MEVISVPMNAVRVCNAIARIGYEPFSALMDIIDNSVAANALNVHIYIDLVEGKTIRQRNNVAKYCIVDNGNGMDEEGIKNALKLGSDANYGVNSLSKYGMGLKSAGFSLGTCVQVISKKDGKLSLKYTLDRKIIEEKNDYVICCQELNASEYAIYEELLSSGPSGTIIEITGCCEIYHTSASTTIDKLKHKLGVTYFPFLSASNGQNLSIVLTFPGEANHEIQPVDILYSQHAIPSFDPTTYNGSAPCIAFKDEWLIQSTGESEAPAIKLEVVAFPQDGMGGAASPLSPEDKERVRSYKVSRDNKGFFIYRNGRLIRWGDDLGIISKDLYGFRARMELFTEHDDLLHVDVSKQRLEMDDEARNKLDVLMRSPRKIADQVFKRCKELLLVGDGEGVGFSETAESVPEEDPVEDITPPDPKEKKERATTREKETKKILDAIKPNPSEQDSLGQTQNDEFSRVRYSDDLHSMNLWSTQKDAVQGTFIIINRRHAFYQSILSNFEDSSPQRLALEALIFCSAVGENKTFENLTSVNDENIRKVFERYYTVLSYNLGEWAGGNQHIFEKI